MCQVMTKVMIFVHQGKVRSFLKLIQKTLIDAGIDEKWTTNRTTHIQSGRFYRKYHAQLISWDSSDPTQITAFMLKLPQAGQRLILRRNDGQVKLQWLDASLSQVQSWYQIHIGLSRKSTYRCILRDELHDKIDQQTHCKLSTASRPHVSKCRGPRRGWCFGGVKFQVLKPHEVTLESSLKSILINRWTGLLETWK